MNASDRLTDALIMAFASLTYTEQKGCCSQVVRALNLLSENAAVAAGTTSAVSPPAERPQPTTPAKGGK
jgi:hypothetical protein